MVELMDTDEMSCMKIEEKMNCMKLLYAKHVIKVLPEIIKEKCFGCVVDHPSQKHHNVCLMMEKDEKIEICMDDALQRINEEEIFNEFLDLFPREHTYTTHDPSNFYDYEEWKGKVYDVVYLLF